MADGRGLRYASPRIRSAKGIECHPWPPPGRHDLGSGGSVAAKRTKKGNGKEPLGFEQKLWAAADKMRGHMDPSEYKHVTLGLIFLKYISDAFDERYEQLTLWTNDPSTEYFVREEQERYEVVEDRNEYAAQNVFWVPVEARWKHLQ